MPSTVAERLRTSALVAVTVAVTLLGWSPPTHARITRIVIDQTTSPAFCTGTPPVCPSFGAAGQYEILIGRAFGELNPDHPLNAIIQDIELGKGLDGKVRYVTSFQLVKPIDMSKSSHLMWHDVPNRGGRITLPVDSRNDGDIGLSSGWQGDNSGGTAVPTNAGDPAAKITGTREWVLVPIAKNLDGSAVTGRVLGRIVNQSGPSSQPILVQANPLPYKPATLDTTQATLVSRRHETMVGVVSEETVIPSGDWAWARCSATNPTNPFPGTPDPTQICIKNGFDPNKLYQVVFTAKDPYVLGVGFAAFRDLAAFFKNELQDDSFPPNPNPVAGGINWIINRGVSQSGNFLRGFLHLGFNQDEAGRRVHDGSWPIIAGRRIALNFRWAQPDGVLELYQAGSEGPQWWHKANDKVRGLPRRGILDRCHETHTCPKIIEHFGSAEIWALKLGIEWVGTDAKHDIPIPNNVRRYYLPSTTHGGGGGGFDQNPPTIPPVRCPGNNYGQGILRANPVPHTQTVNALRFHFRNWVMHGTHPPPTQYPTLKGHKHGNLVEPTKAAMGFPEGIPGLPSTVPEAAVLNGVTVEPGFINPVLDYDWGPQFDPSDGSGVPTNLPPPIKQVIRMLVPRVDADGNELGGVPVVLRDAPLGTYLGWNITAAGFHKDQICNYVGGMIPFARTKAERLASGDPRLSLEERYGDHTGYVAAVAAAAAKAVDAGFLLQADADALIGQASASNVLNP